MDKIAVNVNMFDLYSNVVFNNGDMISSLPVKTAELGPTLVDICNSKNIYTVHFYGDPAFIDGVCYNMAVKEMEMYSDTKINVEVN